MNFCRYFVGLIALMGLAGCLHTGPSEPVIAEEPKASEISTVLEGAKSFQEPLPAQLHGQILGLDPDSGPYRYTLWDVDQDGSSEMLDLIDPTGKLVLRLFDTDGDGNIDVRSILSH